MGKGLALDHPVYGPFICLQAAYQCGTWKLSPSLCTLVQSRGESFHFSFVILMYTVQGSLFQPQHILHLPSTPRGFLHATAGGDMREKENYWSSNCRSNEKHLNTLKYENIGFWVNRQMQMIQILRFSCHHFFFRPQLPCFSQLLSRVLQTRRRPFGELGLAANQEDYQKSRLKPDSMQIAPPPGPLGTSNLRSENRPTEQQILWKAHHLPPGTLVPKRNKPFWCLYIVLRVDNVRMKFGKESHHLKRLFTGAQYPIIPSFICSFIYSQTV